MYFKDFPDFLYDFDITTQRGSGLPASATATIFDGSLSSTNITNGILQAAVNAEPARTLFILTTVGGRPLGDINGTGTVTSADALAYLKWSIGANADVAQVAWIEETLNPYIIANPITYSDYIDGTIGGGVSSINITYGGTGYTSAIISFSPPQSILGITATAEAVIVNGIITEIRIINAGSGYTAAPTVTISTPYQSSKTITKAILMKDVTRNIRFRRDVLANVTVYDEYDIVDGETPEIIAEKVYGNAEYHWIVMLANDRYDYRNDFPLTYVDLQRYIQDKYDAQADAIHHYLDARGYFVDSDFPGAVSVSNRQYEENINESKRRIKIISPQLVNTILKNFRDEL